MTTQSVHQNFFTQWCTKILLSYKKGQTIPSFLYTAHSLLRNKAISWETAAAISMTTTQIMKTSTVKITYAVHFYQQWQVQYRQSLKISISKDQLPLVLSWPVYPLNTLNCDTCYRMRTYIDRGFDDMSLKLYLSFHYITQTSVSQYYWH